MERHVRLLGLLTSIWGGLFALVGVAFLLFSAAALFQLTDSTANSTQVAANLTAGFFAATGAFALFWGIVHLWASALLRRHRPSGRLLMLALALVNLLIMPFGTALGIYAFWVLLTQAGHRLFAPELPASAG